MLHLLEALLDAPQVAHLIVNNRDARHGGRLLFPRNENSPWARTAYELFAILAGGSRLGEDGYCRFGFAQCPTLCSAPMLECRLNRLPTRYTSPYDHHDLP